MLFNARCFALCSALALSAPPLFAEGLDPLAEGKVVELGFGLFAPGNGLQDTLTTPNGGGPQTQSTDLLDFGTGGRVALSYSQPWDDRSRLIVSLTGAMASGDSLITIGPTSETFPGSYDDGLNLPARWTVDMEVETRSAMLMVGREWALSGAWRASLGMQGGTASQDLTANLLAAEGPFTREGELWRRMTTRSNNRMLGVFGGLSHYSVIGKGLGLRLSGTLGVMHNRFDYAYRNDLIPPDLTPFSQEISGSSSGTAVSGRVSARLERSLTSRGVLLFEAGYEGIEGIGNGVDTFLDVEGTATTAKIDSDRIGAGYLTVGYAFRF